MSILHWLKKYNIVRRSDGEGQHIRINNHCNLSKEAIEWIRGELLGDGHLEMISPYSARFQYGSQYLEYIKYVSATLSSFGIEQAGGIYKRCHINMNCHSYHYSSRSYPELLTIKKNWYPEGKKIVPRDIELTPLTIRQWYIGDGSLFRQKYIRLATCGFDISDVNLLVKRLNQLGFKAKRYQSQNEIGFSVKSTKAFLNYIGRCPVKCYQYKWNWDKKKYMNEDEEVR